MTIQVKFSALFWKTLEAHRNEPYYDNLRSKLADFIVRKSVSTLPVSGRDKLFTSSNKSLAGIWHYAIQRNPDVVLFYTIEGSTICMAILGNHHDYPHSGKNFQSSGRTGKRIHNATASGDVKTPLWNHLSWSSPEDLIEHHDLVELSPQALDNLLNEIVAEMNNGNKYYRQHGVAIEDTDDIEFDSYMINLQNVHDKVLSLRTNGYKNNSIAYKKSVEAKYRQPSY